MNVESKLRDVVKAFSRYGYVVLERGLGERILDMLRERGAIHLVQVTRHRKYVVIEINKLACMRECENKCRDTVTGRKLLECFSECMDQCVLERVNELVARILKQG